MAIELLSAETKTKGLTMTPEQALKILHDIVENTRLTGPDRDTVRRAVAVIQNAITPEVQQSEDASAVNEP